MKYYSETMKKFFDTQEQLETEEKEFEEKKNKEEAEKAEKLANISKEKKQLSKAIEEAIDKVQNARAAYTLAKEEAAKILEESNDKAESILNTAKQELKKAESEKTQAIVAFNSKFGPYSTTYTGEKARKEYLETVELINDIFSNFWRF